MDREQACAVFHAKSQLTPRLCSCLYRRRPFLRLVRGFSPRQLCATPGKHEQHLSCSYASW